MSVAASDTDNRSEITSFPCVGGKNDWAYYSASHTPFTYYTMTVVSENIFILPVLPRYSSTAAEADVMALLCLLGLSRQVLQQRAAEELASVGPDRDSEQQAGGQLKWHHISRRVHDSCCVLSGCVQSDWLWVMSQTAQSWLPDRCTRCHLRGACITSPFILQCKYVQQ